MALFEGKTPAERNKTIAALALGALAFIILGRMFFGSSGTKTTTANVNRRQTASRNANTSAAGAAQQAQQEEEIEVAPQPVIFQRAVYGGGEPGRNIFAYYVRPVVTKPTLEATPPPITPTPTPPLVLASLAPQSVYAQTGEFALQVSGDKFTGLVKVYVENQEVPTQFRGPQQLTASVPAQLIQTPGTRQVVVRTPDNALYSNTMSIGIMQPPVPVYTYIGYIERPRQNNEGALLKDPKGELVNVQRNDLLGGRFRVTNISARAVELVDKDLKIKHTLPYVEGRAGSSGPAQRGLTPQPPPPKPEDETEDEEP